MIVSGNFTVHVTEAFSLYCAVGARGQQENEEKGSQVPV